MLRQCLFHFMCTHGPLLWLLPGTRTRDLDSLRLLLLPPVLCHSLGESMSHGLTWDDSSILLTIAVGLYYFALQPWAILARSILVLLTFTLSKASFRQRSASAPPMAAPRGLVEVIELRTKRHVSIETSQSDANLAKCHPQTQSPLYFKLPKELRDYVFKLSCTQSPKEQQGYDLNSYYYRPGHTARLKTYTSLLLTCRRTWLEANALPMREAEHAFWFQRGPHDRHPDAGWQANIRNETDRYRRFFKSLNRHTLANVSHVHLFMQMFQAEQLVPDGRMVHFFPRSLVAKGLKPKRLTVTIRSSDWWDWERGRAICLPDNWVQRMLDCPLLSAVDEFALELETDERKTDQLDAIIQKVIKMEGKPKLADLAGQHRTSACKFVFNGRPAAMRWTRSPRINNMDYETYTGMSMLRLRATTVVWRNRACDLPEPVPQAAYTGHSGLDEGLVFPGFTVRTSHALIFRSRALRERMRSGGWMAGRFPEKEDEMWSGSVRKAVQWQCDEKARYEKMLGDIEAGKLVGQWERQGSLLKFVDSEP